MTSVYLPGYALGGAVETLTVDGYRYNAAGEQGGAFVTQRLPTDSIGTFVLTLSNLVVGSAVQVETQAGAAIENRTASSSSEVFNVPAYTAGDAANNLRIKVRKGSAAPFYQPFETLATALVAAQSIFVNQIPD